jgi:outer membrane protein assembly factor BamD (BamD/ComL family)
MSRRVVVLCTLLMACAPTRGASFEKALAEGRRAHNAGRFEAAAERFDEAARTAKQPRDAVYARYEAALARARAGDVARASRELRAIADATPANAYSAEAAFKAADLAYRSDPQAGIAELEAVIARFPDDAAARLAFFRVLRHDPEAALAKIDALAPRVRGKAVEQDLVYERAKRLAEMGKREEALAAYLDIASRWPYPKGPYFDDALYRASELEEALGRPAKAIEHLERLLSYRETSTVIGTYQRPRYTPALLRIAKLYEDVLHDRARARETLHRLYREFQTSTERDDALWREAELWRKDGDADTACARLRTLVSDFPDSRYVPCAMEKCSVKRPAKSKAPTTCRAYVTREPAKEESKDE